MRFHHVVLGLALFTILNCAKKVRTDEPLITAEENASDSVDLKNTESDSAGDADLTANELQTVYFPFDSSSLTGAAREALKANAAWIKQNPNVAVQVEGHCDERGTTEYNLALGERRAMAARDFLLQNGVPRDRLSTLSYGEERPAEAGSGESIWSRNRRASFAVTK